jgi:hypothetical protein
VARHRPRRALQSLDERVGDDERARLGGDLKPVAHFDEVAPDGRRRRLDVGGVEARQLVHVEQTHHALELDGVNAQTLHPRLGRCLPARARHRLIEHAQQPAPQTERGGDLFEHGGETALEASAEQLVHVEALEVAEA